MSSLEAASETTCLISRDVAPPYDRRPKRTCWQLAANSSIMLGRELCYGLEAGLVVPHLLTRGMPANMYSLVFLIPPMFGFLLQPLMGSTSDRCRSPLGRRRPFILALDVIIMLGLLLFLNDDYVVKGLYQAQADSSSAHVVRLVIGTVGAVLFMFSADSIEGPVRAYLLDTCTEEDQQKGLDLQAAFAGLGGVLGYMSGAVDWRKLGVRPGSEDLVRFGICFSIFVLCAVLNLVSIPEQPLRRSGSFVNEVEDTNKDTTVRVLAVSYGEPLERPRSSGNKGKYGSFGNGVEDTNKDTTVRVLTISYEEPLKIRSTSDNKGDYTNQDTKVSVLTGSTEDRASAQQNGFEQRFGNRTNHSAQVKLGQSQDDKDTPAYAPSALEKSVSISIPTFCTSIVKMPGRLARLCLTQLIAWLGFMAIMLFFTDFMGRRVYGGHPQAAAGSEARRRYEEGVEMGCWGLTINAAACTVISGVADFSLRRLGLRTVYMCGTLLFAVGMAGMVALVELTSEGWPFLLLCPAMGLMYSTLSIVPYRLLSQYHRNEQYMTTGPDGSGRRGMGVDCALLTAQIQLSRVIIGAVMGPVVNAAGTLTVTVIMAAGLAFCAFLATAFLVQYET